MVRLNTGISRNNAGRLQEEYACRIVDDLTFTKLALNTDPEPRAVAIIVIDAEPEQVYLVTGKEDYTRAIDPRDRRQRRYLAMPSEKVLEFNKEKHDARDKVTANRQTNPRVDGKESSKVFVPVSNPVSRPDRGHSLGNEAG